MRQRRTRQRSFSRYDDKRPPLFERDVRDGIAAVLRASSVGPDFASTTRRARYTRGSIGDRTVPDYVAEEGVDPANRTETLAEIEVSIDN